MRICRYTHNSEVSFGVVDGDLDDGTAGVTPIAGHPFAPFSLQGPALPMAEVRLLAPVLPSKVVCVGKNYADHAAEMGGEVPPEPVLFIKPSTSVLGPNQTISYPHQSSDVHHEAELAVVIGRLCRDVPVERVQEVVLGYSCANDVTARDLQARDGQWTRAKSFDTFCPIGPWVATNLDVTDVAIECRINGEVRQSGRTSEMVRSVPELIAYVSSVMTLLPGDVVLTGTPAGVGPMQIGDKVSVSIENVGTLTNKVERRAVFAGDLAASAG